MSANQPAASSEVTVILGDPRLPDAMKRTGRFEAEDFEAFARMKRALAELPEYRFRYLEDHSALLDALRAQPPRFVLNFCDTGFRNVAAHELHIPAMLELLGIPYSGATPACMALCYDKGLVRAAAAALGIPVPAEAYLIADADALPAGVRFPALIKPSCGDGSIGIRRESVVRDAGAAWSYVERLRRELPGRDLLIQEFLPGAEYSVGLIGNPGTGFEALPVLEVDYSGLDAMLPRLLAYESKADPESAYWSDIKYREARLDAAARARLAQYSECLFARFGCRDYARFDFRADVDGEIKLLEVNPNAAWCWDGKLNMMAGFTGYDYPAFLRLILEAAITRTRVSSGK